MRGVGRWIIAAALALLTPGIAAAEDGYRLWLRHAPLSGVAAPLSVETTETDPTLTLASAELRRAAAGWGGSPVARRA